MNIFYITSKKFNSKRFSLVDDQKILQLLWVNLPFTQFNQNFITTLAEVNRNWSITKENILANEPKQLKKLKFFENVAPADAPPFYHKKLSKTNSNPRSILKLYHQYTSMNDVVDYPWLIRAFGQLGNVFGFNSYWPTKDKQALHGSLTFKQMIYDIIDRKHMIKPKNVPRILYSMACLEYRIASLFPILLVHIKDNIQFWKSSTLANMILCLSIMGIGDLNGDNVFETTTQETSDFSGIVLLMIQEVYNRCQNHQQDLSAFSWASLCYSMVLLGLYEQNPQILPYFLLQVNSTLSTNNLPFSGWVQFYLYQILYFTDVEKPKNEIEIKKAVPMEIQESLYNRWLPEIILKGQNQGSEKLQLEFDKILNDIKQDAIMNCSVGRSFDTQHAIFCGHLIKSRNLAIEYDYLAPIGPGRPKLAGIIQCKKRILEKLGLHLAIIHKTFWENLESDQKVEEALKLISQFPETSSTQPTITSDTTDDGFSQRFLKHKKKTIDTWPPEKLVY